MARSVRVAIKLFAFGVMVCSLIGPYTVLLCVAPKCCHVVARWFFKGCLQLTSVRLDVRGMLAPNASILVANHASYLDIPILGALSSKSAFVAKQDVYSWPVFGVLARISQTIFISRKPNDALLQIRQIAKRVIAGQSIILFPEGTSTDGSYVRPFKSSLFSVFDQIGGEVWVQPITIAYDRLSDGTPMSKFQRDDYAWYGDMTLFPHLMRIFGHKGCRVNVIFHDPVRAADFTHRKILAAHCHRLILDTLMECIHHGTAPRDHHEAEIQYEAR